MSPVDTMQHVVAQLEKELSSPERHWWGPGLVALKERWLEDAREGLAVAMAREESSRQRDVGERLYPVGSRSPAYVPVKVPRLAAPLTAVEDFDPLDDRPDRDAMFDGRET